MSTNNKGSLWRIWDLHVHSPATYGGDYSTFIEEARKCKADVLGINDYCTLNGYKEIIRLGGIPNKVIFPAVEFRMHNLLSSKKKPNGVRINFHIIFNNDPSIFPKIETWVASLNCLDEKGNSIQLGTAGDLLKVSLDFEHVVDSLKKLNLYETHAIIWLPYDEYGGINEIDPVTDGVFKLSLINKSHVIGTSTKKQIDFFKWEDEKYTTEQYKEWFGQPKPCIKGSDAHRIDYPFGHLMDASSQPTERFCWINADTTFNGLKQIIIEPNRVFIGDEPDLLKRVRLNQTKFIKSLSIQKISGATVDDSWFDNFTLDLNSSLVAIIGNKGGGKSAITDIMGLCGNTHQDPSNFSFLNNTKFRRPKPLNLSERFEATLVWENGTTITKRLNENPNNLLAERVKYIPQNFLERLCTNVESDEFEKELKQIIYSHTPSDKRLNKSSLDELIQYKSSLVTAEILQLQTELNLLNAAIIVLENKSSDDFKTSIENLLEVKKGELTVHLTVQPIKPETGNESHESAQLIERLTTLRTQITTVESEIAELLKTKSSLTVKKEELSRAVQYYRNLDEQLKKAQDEKNEHIQVLLKNGITQSDIFSYTVDTSKISDLLDVVAGEILAIGDSLNPKKSESKTYQLQRLTEELTQGHDVLDKPAREQQKYLDDLKTWEAKKSELEGEETAEGTIKFYESQLGYLNTTLGPELTAKYHERNDLVVQLHAKKISLIEIRKELFQPVTLFIENFKELKKRYDVKIDVALEFRSFPDIFFSMINQSRIGTFSGKEEGYKKLLTIIEKANFNTSKGFIEFAEELVDNLKHDKRTSSNTPVDIQNQLRKGVELQQLYDYIYGYEFLQPVYNLKLGTKTLIELSPGERGALLLIFYLILDNDDIPLVIDQPEENLDNESVYHILVHFIKKVKEKRQIIIVTHNPNLAIVCDADQIVNMHIEKENKNAVTFDSGAIENETINKAIVNVLEGTMPAFNNRDSKYIRV